MAIQAGSVSTHVVTIFYRIAPAEPERIRTPSVNQEEFLSCNGAAVPVAVAGKEFMIFGHSPDSLN